MILKKKISEKFEVSFEILKVGTYKASQLQISNFFQVKQDHVSSVHPEKLPKTRPSNSRLRADQNVMVQSCPTPPQSRRKFFLSPKALRNSITQSHSERQSVESTMSGKFQPIDSMC